MVADVEVVFLRIRDDGPSRNLLVHHRCSDGRDSVGFELEEVANMTDFVGAWNVFKLADDLI